jgi:hypothetical protein
MTKTAFENRTYIFQIGFNKSATTSLFELFRSSGYKAVHGGGRRWRLAGYPSFQGINIHRVVHENIEVGRRPIEGFEEFDAFFDMEQTAHSEMLHNYLHFDVFAEAYPKAKFILNFRDVEAWIRSRTKHGKGRYVFHMTRYYDTDEAGLADIWRRQYHDHIARVRGYFKDKPGRLFEFRLEDQPVKALCDFLRPEYDLQPDKWQQLRASNTPEPSTMAIAAE